MGVDNSDRHLPAILFHLGSALAAIFLAVFRLTDGPDLACRAVARPAMPVKSSVTPIALSQFNVCILCLGLMMLFR